MRFVLPCYSACQPPNCDKMPYFFKISNPPPPPCLQYQPMSEPVWCGRVEYLCPSDIYHLYIHSLVKSSSTHVISQSFIFKLSLPESWEARTWAFFVGVESTPGQHWTPQNQGLTKAKSKAQRPSPQSRSTLNFFTLSSTPSPVSFINLTNFSLLLYADITCTRSYSFDSFFVNITNAVK